MWARCSDPSRSSATWLRARDEIDDTITLEFEEDPQEAESSETP